MDIRLLEFNHIVISFSVITIDDALVDRRDVKCEQPLVSSTNPEDEY